MSVPEVSIATADTSLSVKDSPLPNALDIYYDNILRLVKEGGTNTSNDKLLINNTITSFDIAPDTPFFNEGLFARFADRVFKSSPDNLGTAARSDRFSAHYEQLIKIAASGIDQQYEAIVPKVEALQTKLAAQTTALANRIGAINKQWVDLATSMGLKPSDSDYELKYVAYLEQIRYADQIKQYSLNIDMLDNSIDAVRRAAYKEDEQAILDAMNELSETKKIARPLRPTFERSAKSLPVTELTFANPLYRSGSIMDISPATLPLGDLSNFLSNGGTRQITITKSATSTEQHDKSWGGNGGGSFSIFGIGIGGSGGGSGSSSYIQNVKSTNGIDISFENMAEVLIDRGLWFNPGIFQKDSIVKKLKKLPGYDRLQYVSVSLVIARGTKLTLKFDNAVDTTQWSKKALAGSGGVSIFGYRFGGSGSTNSYDYTVETSADGKSVTFKDDPLMTRLLAVRLENFAPMGPGPGITSIKQDFEKFKKGEISYIDLQSRKFQ